jgi:hypothetical protein
MQNERELAKLALRLMKAKAVIEFEPDLRPMRRVHNKGKRKPIGRYPSYKIRRALTWESVCERELMWQSESDPDVISYYDQPHKVTIRLPEMDGKTMIYFPDMLRKLVNGSVEVIEVKKTLDEIKNFEDGDYARKLQLAELAYKAAGIRFRVVTGEDDIRIEPLFSNVINIQRCRFTKLDTLDNLRFHEALDATDGIAPLGRVIEAVSENGNRFDPVACSKVLALVVQRAAWIDIRKQINHDTPVRRVVDRIKP